MVEQEQLLRNEMVRIGKIMHRRNLIAAMDGNISARLDSERILVTPTGVNKGFMTAGDLAVTGLDGRMLEGTRPPSSEILLHLKVYELRPDVKAVIHAHPPLAVALTIAGVSLETPVLPEVVLTMGGIPTTDYATPSSPEGPAAIAPFVPDFRAIMLRRHGSVTMGKTLMEAYNLLEKVEHAAAIILAAHQAGGVTVLDSAQVETLRDMGRKKGFLR